MGLPFREKANSGLPRVFPTSALTRMTSDMAVKAIKKRKASSTVGFATSSASLENMKLMPKMALANRANTNDRVWVFLLCIAIISLSKYGLSYHINVFSATGNLGVSLSGAKTAFGDPLFPITLCKHSGCYGGIAAEVGC